MKALFVCAAVSCALVVVSGTAWADLIVYTDRTSFVAASGVSDGEGFESASPVNTDLSALVLDDFTITNAYTSAHYLEFSTVNADVHPSEGSQYVRWTFPGSASQEVGRLDISHGSSISAVGFTLIDALDQPGGGTITFETGAGATAVLGSTAGSTPLANANEFFVGVISTESFSTYKLTYEGKAPEGFGLDDFVYGLGESPVPEPTSLALFGLGAIGLAAVRRRRRVS